MRYSDSAASCRIERLPLSGPAGVEEQGFADAVLSGLEAASRSLPCRFIYDEAGGRLFEQICRQPEYYVTRAEAEIFQLRAAEIAADLGAPREVVELGSGSAVKTAHLLRALLLEPQPLTYVPVDICREVVVRSGERLLAELPGLRVVGLEGTYEEACAELAAKHGGGRRALLWLGSNAGNFSREDAAAFLCRIRPALNPGERLLLGVDRRKDRATLEAAYDDAAGVTAAFNLNLLARINRELGGEFELSRFAHRASYDEDSGTVHMHLVSCVDQEVRVAALGRSFAFGKDEMIHTECSTKYSDEEVRVLAEQCGLEISNSWRDSAELFTLWSLTPTGA